MTSASSPDSAYAYAYDGEGRVSSVDNNGTPNVPHVVLSDQYDANGNRTSLAATIAGTADFLNSYSYDALNRLTQLCQASQTGGNAVATKGANLAYNLLGQLTTVARTNFFGVGPAPDIATSTFSYDDANRLTEIANTTNGGTAIDAYSWTYDAANRVSTFTTTTDGTATYSYDNTNQLVGATYTTNPGATQPANESYSFDANGNRTNTGYTTGTNNQLTSDGTFNYGYDDEGNRITRTRISNSPANDYKTTYTWDYRDRLADVEFYNNSNVLTKHVHYIYDVFDHLIGKQVDDTGSGSYNRAEFYVLDGNYVVLQFDLNGNLTERYLNGPSASGVDVIMAEEDVTSLTSPGDVTWPLTDDLGTVRDIVNSAGAVIDHLVDNSFGQVAYESAPTVHHLEGYTGAIYDPDTGMTNNWHRWYDPATGRFISEDPIGFAAGDANLSRYVANRPNSSVDATGFFPEKGKERELNALRREGLLIIAEELELPTMLIKIAQRHRVGINACDRTHYVDFISINSIHIVDFIVVKLERVGWNGKITDPRDTQAYFGPVYNELFHAWWDVEGEEIKVMDNWILSLMRQSQQWSDAVGMAEEAMSELTQAVIDLIQRGEPIPSYEEASKSGSLKLFMCPGHNETEDDKWYGDETADLIMDRTKSSATLALRRF